jgi:hypothetical protein
MVLPFTIHGPGVVKSNDLVQHCLFRRLEHNIRL